jgi:hypothetical protein
MVTIPIKDTELTNTFISLNNNNSSGYDEIPNKIGSTSKWSLY